MHDELPHTSLLWGIWLVQRAHEQAIAQHEPFIEGRKFLHLQRQASVTLGDEIFKCLDCLWSRGREQFLPLLASILHFRLVILVCHFDLFLQLFLALLSRLHASEAEVSSAVTRFRVIVLLS